MMCSSEACSGNCAMTDGLFEDSTKLKGKRFYGYQQHSDTSMG
jgi:hypothetical protein